MPLVGFTAQIIPYIMAMFFTMIIFNGDGILKAEKQTTKSFSTENHVTFSENSDATPNSYHFENHTNFLFINFEFATVFQNRRVCSLCSSFRNRFTHTSPVKVSPHRGPPCHLS